jgi:ferritin-like metal-binding protein YciE
MAKAASSEKLRSGFEEHLEQTKGHVSRLEKIFKSLRESPTGKKCKGMEGLIEEGSEIIDEDLRDGVKDAGLIGAAQRVEHYEIAAYGTVGICGNPWTVPARISAEGNTGRRKGNRRKTDGARKTDQCAGR